jgi:hypothetical protein
VPLGLPSRAPRRTVTRAASAAPHALQVCFWRLDGFGTVAAPCYFRFTMAEDILDELSDIDKKWQGQYVAIPRYLYHYTNGAGLEGILKSGSFWATHYRYLNDTSEMLLGVDLFHEVVAEAKAKISHPIASEFLQRLRLHDERAPHVYMVCFCEKLDLLNQWRVYANNNGFALGFEICELYAPDGRAPAMDYHGCSLLKVEYDRTKRRKELLDTVLLIVDAFNRHEADISEGIRGEAIDRAITITLVGVLPMILSFKHRAFDVEHEWRLVQLGAPTRPVKVRATARGLVPYAEVPATVPMSATCSDRYLGRMPLRFVQHGPTAEPDKVKLALKFMLDSYRYDDAEVSGSQLPIRPSSNGV